MALIIGSCKPVDDYFENFWVERKTAVAGRYFDRLDVCPRLDAVLPLNYSIAFRVYESLRNARRTRTHLKVRQASRGIKSAGASPMRPLKKRPQKCVRAFEWSFHGRTQQYHSMNQLRKMASELARVDTAQAVANNDDLSAGLATRLAQDLFQTWQSMNWTIHVAQYAGVKDPVAKLAETHAERAQTQISGTETRYQQNSAAMTTHIWKRRLEEIVKREGGDLSENASFAEQGCKAWL